MLLVPLLAASYRNVPQQDLLLIMAKKPLLNFLLKNVYSTGLIQLFEAPNHWAIGANTMRIFSFELSSSIGPPSLTIVKITYKGSQDMTKRTTTITIIFTTFNFDLCMTTSALVPLVSPGILRLHTFIQIPM